MRKGIEVDPKRSTMRPVEFKKQTAKTKFIPKKRAAISFLVSKDILFI